MATIYVGDIGTKILLNAGSDISDATTLQIICKKPSGTNYTWTAILEGTNYAYYNTVSGDIDAAGTYQVQLYAVLASGWSGYGGIGSFTVEGVL